MSAGGDFYPPRYGTYLRVLRETTISLFAARRSWERACLPVVCALFLPWPGTTTTLVVRYRQSSRSSRRGRSNLHFFPTSHLLSIRPSVPSPCPDPAFLPAVIPLLPNSQPALSIYKTTKYEADMDAGCGFTLAIAYQTCVSRRWNSKPCLVLDRDCSANELPCGTGSSKRGEAQGGDMVPRRRSWVEGLVPRGVRGHYYRHGR